MSFKKNGYIIIKKAISEELATFVYEYFLLKRHVVITFMRSKHIPDHTDFVGTWADSQVYGTYSHYSDIAMETLLMKVKPIMEEKTKLKLIPNYSYARIYKKGDILHRHKDRFSCEISTTLNLGGNPWPIFINPNKKEGKSTTKGYKASKSKGVKVILSPGDMLVYRGNILEHWRDKFEGENCGQVFLHYNDINTPGATENIFDRRPHLGLPASFKQK
jgi:hypothetical protein